MGNGLVIKTNTVARFFIRLYNLLIYIFRRDYFVLLHMLFPLFP